MLAREQCVELKTALRIILLAMKTNHQDQPVAPAASSVARRRGASGSGVTATPAK